MYVFYKDLYDISHVIKATKVEPMAPKWAPDAPNRMACVPERVPGDLKMCQGAKKNAR